MVFENYTLREICVIVFSLFRSPIRMDRKMGFKCRKMRFFITQLCKKKKKCVILFCTFLVFGFFVFFTFLFYFFPKHNWSRFKKVKILLKKNCKNKTFFSFWFLDIFKNVHFWKTHDFCFWKVYMHRKNFLYITI
jgi:hypothetical protein